MSREQRAFDATRADTEASWEVMLQFLRAEYEARVADPHNFGRTTVEVVWERGRVHRLRTNAENVIAAAKPPRDDAPA